MLKAISLAAMNVLVVEDDPLLGDGLVQALGQSGYEVELAVNGTDALAWIEQDAQDLVILDLGLPDMDGLDVLRRIRARRMTVPVLVLTARDGVEQRVAALDTGCDDYIEKPFDLRELEARVRALMRRAHVDFAQEASIGRLTLDPFAREVRVDGRLLDMRAREYEVLEMLVTNRDHPVAKERLALRLTANNDDIGENAVEVYIHRLRRRLSEYGLSIRTVRSRGYLIEDAEHGA